MLRGQEQTLRSRLRARPLNAPIVIALRRSRRALGIPLHTRVGVDAVGEQGEVRRRGAPLAGTADSSPVETPSGSPTTSCGRV